MKALLLAQAHSPSTNNIISAFEGRGHDLTVVYYHDHLAQDQEPTARMDGNCFAHDGGRVNPADFEIAMLRSWGTAALGATFLKACEDAGVTVLNPTEHTAIMDSKAKSAGVFRSNSDTLRNFPKTTVVQGGRKNLAQIFGMARIHCRTDTLVYKPDYGTQGQGIQFVSSAQDLINLRGAIENNTAPYILQEFIGDPEVPIQHYRTIVSGGMCLPKATLLTASDPLKPGNLAQGGTKEFIDVPGDVVELSVRAAAASKLAFSGVDIMRRPDGRLVFLEVNDGPELASFERVGVKAAEQSVIALEQRHLGL